MSDISGSNGVSDGSNGLYTPTTEEVRKNWQENRNLRGGVIGMFSIEQFDRWLAEVKAQAWDEGYESVTITTVANPYRQGEEQ